MASAAVADPRPITPPNVQRANQTGNASEVEQAKCECCGLTEECTPAYIWQVRGVHCGKWVCGLCAEAVKEELGRGNEGIEDALKTHMGVCMQFNGIERKANPVMDIALAMKRLLRRSVNGAESPRSTPSSPRRGGTIARTNSCMTLFSRGRGPSYPL
ncbi:hypothetical protein GOP47_0011030 [Adiantum capillus-veneris]|uniref:Uncharacterized protein n=1 Tax=Adiantum capillus-veneris TaxID=13818 RepID=A0A9D4ZGY6_ADICA|nr:hypothetical protein GOP47_0011030 [Adiantum capillus-veneris]